MFGPINYSSITLTNSHLIAAFGSQFYVFNTGNQVCQGRVDFGHQSHIVAVNIIAGKDACDVHSIDRDGVYITANLSFSQSEGLKCGKIEKFSVKGKKDESKIASATFLGTKSILFINANKKLNCFNIQNKALSNMNHQFTFSTILSSHNDSKVFITHQNQKKISIFSKENLKEVKQYEHNSKITASISIEKLLVIGDEKGKITLFYDFFNEQKNKGKQFSSVLQWHTSPILALSSNGQYIYSAGEESVVVLWHTRDLSRDFLPRVGTAIRSIIIKSETNEIICGLADNSIKVIDLSRDKETYSYKTLVDPKGYAPQQGFRFSSSTTSYINGTLCLNSLPGKVQFINLNKNAENTELEIVPRNLVNNINQDKIEPHRINGFSFSQDRSVMMVSLLVSSNPSYLKFYRKGVQGYELINKIQNPHKGQTKCCQAVSSVKGFQFLTFSPEDRKIRVWSECKERKKSIIDTNEVYWRCSEQIQFRNLLPTSITTLKSIISVVYGHTQIKFYGQSSQGHRNTLFGLSSKEKIKQVQLIHFQNIKDKTILKIMVVKDPLQLQTWICTKNKNDEVKVHVQEKLNFKDKANFYFIVVGTKQTAVIISGRGSSQILILDNKTFKFTSSFDSDTQIQTVFWKDQKLILIGSDLTLSSLDGSEFIKFQKEQENQETQMEEESTEVRNYGEANILKLNQRWVERESVKNKKKVFDCLQGLELYPNCTSIWTQISERLLL